LDLRAQLSVSAATCAIRVAASSSSRIELVADPFAAAAIFAAEVSETKKEHDVDHELQ
jgi:hypothetical protein